MNHQISKVLCRYKLKYPRLSSRRLDGSLLGAQICVRHERHVSTKVKPSPKWNQKDGKRADKGSASICASALLTVKRLKKKIIISKWGKHCKAEDWHHAAFGATWAISSPWNWISADMSPPCPILSFMYVPHLLALRCSTTPTLSDFSALEQPPHITTSRQKGSQFIVRVPMRIWSLLAVTPRPSFEVSCVSTLS